MCPPPEYPDYFRGPTSGENGDWWCKKCEFPFQRSGGQCIKPCPKCKPDLDLSTGTCVPRPNQESCPTSCPDLKGNPIHAATGEKIQAESPDFVGDGRYPLYFSRLYKSHQDFEINSLHHQSFDENGGAHISLPPKEWVIHTQPLGYQGPTNNVGWNTLASEWVSPEPEGLAYPVKGHKLWRHNYESRLYQTSRSGAAYIVMQRPDFSKQWFRKDDSSGHYLHDNLGNSRLETLTDGDGEPVGYLYQLADGQVERYNLSGLLVEKNNAEGLRQELTYIGDRLTSVTDPAGRQIAFSYNSQGWLSELTTPDGQRITYDYDALGNLTEVRYPDDTPATNNDNPRQVYRYGRESQQTPDGWQERIVSPYLLTEKWDENGDAHARWTFDEFGRGTSSRREDDFERVTLAYDWDAASQTQITTVTEAGGRVSRLHYKNGRQIKAEGGDCGGCGSSDVAESVYDGAGRLTQQTDFNGHVTRYSYNSRGLVTSKISAYGTADAVTITTEWHSDYALPTEVVTAYKRTEYQYGDRGRLTQVKEVSLSANPAAPAERVTTYQYNTQGQLLSINGPRTDVSDITTFTYDAGHDVKTISNALGHISTINRRDLNGRPLSVTDPNGVETTLAYDVRGRFVRSTTAGEITEYDYDPVGQLIQLTLPGGETLHYRYNGARYLTQVRDSAGNTLNYQYDLAGNVTVVEVKDSTDRLVQTQQQAYDSLGRLASMTDALGNTTAYEYDPLGNLLRSTSPLLNVTKYDYNGLGQQTESTD
ncbi:DUF6531 domain-containing protein, partial [Corallincola spongiicola]